jgi:hypothetical protein
MQCWIHHRRLSPVERGDRGQGYRPGQWLARFTAQKTGFSAQKWRTDRIRIWYYRHRKFGTAPSSGGFSSCDRVQRAENGKLRRTYLFGARCCSCGAGNAQRLLGVERRRTSCEFAVSLLLWDSFFGQGVIWEGVRVRLRFPRFSTRDIQSLVSTRFVFLSSDAGELVGRKWDLDLPLLQEDVGCREIESCELLASATKEAIIPARLAGFNQVMFSMLSTCGFG